MWVEAPADFDGIPLTCNFDLFMGFYRVIAGTFLFMQKIVQLHAGCFRIDYGVPHNKNC